LSDQEKLEKARQQQAAAAAAYQGKRQPAGEPKCSEQLERQIREVLPESGITPQQLKARLDQLGIAKLRDLTEKQAMMLHEKLLQRKSEKMQSDAAQKLAESGTTPEGADVGEEIKAPVSGETIAEIKSLLPKAKIMPARFREMLGRYETEKVSDLRQGQADELLSELKSKAAGEQTDESGDGDGDANAPGGVTVEQLERIKSLIDDTGWPYDKQVEWLNQRGVNSFRSISADDATSLVSKLESVRESFAGSGSVKN